MRQRDRVSDYLCIYIYDVSPPQKLNLILLLPVLELAQTVGLFQATAYHCIYSNYVFEGLFCLLEAVIDILPEEILLRNYFPLD